MKSKIKTVILGAAAIITGAIIFVINKPGGSTPVISVAPQITGTDQVGNGNLTVSTGTWTNNPTSYTYQWQRADDLIFSTNVTSIGTNSNTYTLVVGDNGKYHRVIVTATNGSGSSAANTIVIGPTAPSGAELANLWMSPTGGTCGPRSASPAIYDASKACGTFEAADALTQAGDTVLVKGGTTYPFAVLTVNKAAPGVTFRKAAGETPIVNGLQLGPNCCTSISNHTFDGISVDGCVNVKTGVNGLATNLTFQNGHIYHISFGSCLVNLFSTKNFKLLNNELGPFAPNGDIIDNVMGSFCTMTATATVTVAGTFNISHGAGSNCSPTPYTVAPMPSPIWINNSIGPIFCNSQNSTTFITCQLQSGGTGGTITAGDAVEFYAPTPQNLLVDGNYIHDPYDSCSKIPIAMLAQYGGPGACFGLGYGDLGKTTTITSAIDATTDPVTFTVAPKADHVNGTHYWPLPDNVSAPFLVLIDSERIKITNINGNTWTGQRAQGCNGINSVKGAHSSGATLTMCDDGRRHPDGMQSFGCHDCAITHNRIYAINPPSPPNAAQGLYFEFTSSEPKSHTSLTFANNAIACGCGSVTFAIGNAPQANARGDGYFRFLHNSVQGVASIGTQPGQTWPNPGMTILYAGNIIAGNIHSGPASEALDACYFTASDGSHITFDGGGNLFATFSGNCAASDMSGSASYVSTDPFAPDFHLANNTQPAAHGGDSPYCGPPGSGKLVTDDLEGHPRPASGCSAGAFQAP